VIGWPWVYLGRQEASYLDQDLKLYDAEIRLAGIVWEHEPVQSGELAK